MLATGRLPGRFSGGMAGWQFLAGHCQTRADGRAMMARQCATVAHSAYRCEYGALRVTQRRVFG
jgi:hypothetical protein